MTIKINGLKDAIEKARNQKQKLKDDHDKAYKEWREQNEIEEKIKWIKREKAKLLRKKQEEEYEAQLKAEEERRIKEREEHEKLYGKPRKWQPQIDICENLIHFLDSFKPKDDESNLDMEGGPTYNAENVNQKLTSGEWKKEKMHVFKKEQDWEESLQPGQNKKKGKKNKKNKNAKEAEGEPKLTLTIETLNYFDEVAVQAPIYQSQVLDTMKLVREKKDYFTRISDELNEGKKPEGENEETPKEEENKEAQAKPEKKAKKEKINLDDEEMFPAM